ncbi:electron transfer flavoprotein beta subunit [Arboricoccus pini]|uniref:Electron transfer flavoprotein beta subunit n=1 Tax=Arboricoccus pini TaxID=1963835 RepID=A0A212R8X0_9PROT|nr:electron transfer flavoprotein subunit beta [Arboricoccus pini]SNB68595.1 electron transfer flavoprotein beta subunit [Arboricoccus pini]
MTGLAIVVLLSLGRHPATGRPRRNPDDARALATALALAATRSGSRVLAVHAGDPRAPVLRDYLGQGLDELTVLDMPSGSDPLPSLREHLVALSPDLLLTGQRAENGEASGLLPYLLAEALGMTLVPGVVGLDLQGDQGRFTQALPRGRRRQIEARLPLAATIPAGTAGLPLPSFAAARRGRIVSLPALASPDPHLVAIERQPWRQLPRPQPRRLKGSAIDRLKSMTGGGEAKGRLLVDPDPETAAAQILDRLGEIGLIRASHQSVTSRDTDGRTER